MFVPTIVLRSFCTIANELRCYARLGFLVSRCKLSQHHAVDDRRQRGARDSSEFAISEMFHGLHDG